MLNQKAHKIEQLLDIEESPKILLKLGNSQVLPKLINNAVETNTTTHSKDSVVVSLIGKQKTFKSTHANLIFQTNFPKGMLGMEQTTKGILVESCVLNCSQGKLNVQCLDYEGFGSTGRNLQSQEEKAIDNKLMLLAYSISNVVIFSMHAGDVSPFREFVQLMRMCVKGIRTDKTSKKPSLIIFVNTTLGDKNSIIMNVLNEGFGMTPEQIREGIHSFASKNIINQTKDLNDCQMFFSDISIETMYPHSLGNETESFIIDSVKESIISKCFLAESQDTRLLYDENRWNETISSINSNEQIEFASDVLGRISESVCSAKFQQLKNLFEMQAPKMECISDLNELKSKMMVEYWKEAKGKWASEYGEKLESIIQTLYQKTSRIVSNNQMVVLSKEFEKELSKFLENENFSATKLNNFYNSYLEKCEIHYSDKFETQEFKRFMTKIGNKYDEMMEDYFQTKRNETEGFIKQKLKNETIDFDLLFDELETVQERLTQFKILDKALLEKWNQRLLSLIAKKKQDEEELKEKSLQLRNDIFNFKHNFLNSLEKVETVDEMNLLVKKSLILIDSNRLDKDSFINLESFINISSEEYMNRLIPIIISRNETEFTNALDSGTAENIKSLFESHFSRIPKTNSQMYDLSKKRIENKFKEFIINKYVNEYKTNNYQSAMKWIQVSIDKGFNDDKAHYFMAEMLKNGNSDISISLEKAFENYLISAEMGHIESQFCLALMYSKGEGTTQSDKEAITWFEKASKKGHEGAQLRLKERNNVEQVQQPTEKPNELESLPTDPYQLGMTYHDKGDYENAFIWLTKASEINDQNAWFALGSMYLNGRAAATTVSSSKIMAFECFEKAEKFGNSKATEFIELMFNGLFRHRYGSKNDPLRLQLLKFLREKPLRYKVDLSILNPNGEFPPLAWFVENNDEEVVTELLSIKGIDVNKEGTLARACKRGFKEMVKLLCKHPDIDIRTGNTEAANPLQAACQGKHMEIVLHLMNIPGSVELINMEFSYGYGPKTAFIEACANGSIGIVFLFLKLLLHHKVKPNFGNSLFWACANNHINIVTLLLQYDVDVNGTRPNIPLEVAVEKNHQEIVKLLLESTGIIKYSNLKEKARSRGYIEILNMNWD